MKVTIFGNGFIGHNAAITFKSRGAKITVVTDHPSYDLDVDMISYDSTRAQNLNGDVAIWATGPSTGPRECLEVGSYIAKFEKFLKLLNYFKLSIYISGVMGESSRVNLWSPYSVMHYTCENLLKLTLKNACILRVNPVYGPYQREGKLVVNAIRAKLNSEKLKVSDAFVRRDFVYVKDLTQDILDYTQRFVSCGEESVGVRTFNICSGELITVETVCEILGVQWVPTYRVEEPDTGFSCKTDRSPGLTYTSIAVGLRETLQWYKDNMKMLNEKSRVTD